MTQVTDPAAERTNVAARSTGGALLPLIVSVTCATVTLLFPSSPWTLLAVLGTTLIAVFAGHMGLVTALVAVSLPLVTTTLLGVPFTLALVVVMLAGSALRGSLRRLPGLPLFLGIFIGLSTLINPPTTPPGWVALFSLVFLTLGILAISYLPRGGHRGDVWALAAVIVTVGYALVGVYTSLAGTYARYETVRVFESILGSSNSAAWKAAVVGVLALTFAAKRRGFARVLIFAAALPFLAAPIVLASRGALLAQALGLCLIAFQQRRRRSLTLLLLGFAAALAALAHIASANSWFIWRRLTGGGLTQADITSGRIELWTISWSSFMDNPLAGLGPGRLTDTLYSQTGIAYAHNLPVEIVAQFGTVAGIAFLLYLLPRPFSVDNMYLPAIATALAASMVEPAVATPVGSVLYLLLLIGHRNLQTTIQEDD